MYGADYCGRCSSHSIFIISPGCLFACFFVCCCCFLYNNIVEYKLWIDTMIIIVHYTKHGCLRNAGFIKIYISHLYHRCERMTLSKSVIFSVSLLEVGVCQQYNICNGKFSSNCSRNVCSSVFAHV